MLFRTYPPAPNLRNWVRFYWSLESEQPYTHYGMASVCPELVFHYKGRFDDISANGELSPSFTAGLQAPSRYTKKFITHTGFGIFGAYLYPQAVPQIFGCPAPALYNQMEDLQTLLGGEGSMLEEKIANSITHDQRITILNSFFEQRLAKIKDQYNPVFGAICNIVHNNISNPVKKTASEYYLSERQFERQFIRYAGMSPKLFSRIVRFHRALEMYDRQKKSLTQIAYDCGYYDQSHFIHDFREFSGQQPGEYFSGDSAATSWRD